jgi:hypothetical protein
VLQFEPFLSRLLVPIAGFRIGLERQQNAASDTSGPAILGGARTHPLVAIVGDLLVKTFSAHGARLGSAARGAVHGGLSPLE